MNIMLAEITWTQLGEIIGALGGLATIAGFFTAWIIGNRKVVTKLDQEPVPEVRKASPRFNHALAEQRHGEVTRRLDAAESEIDQIWNTMRAEDAAIRKETGTKFDAILLALGEIKGELKSKK